MHLPSHTLWTRFRRDWFGSLKRTYAASNDDNLGLIAAGAAFYAFSSIAPILAATVLTYGLVASPETVRDNIQALFATLPRDAASLISGQLDTVVDGSSGKKGFALLLALGIALYGGSKAASSMMTALDVAFGVKESRGIVTSTLTALALVAGGVVLVLSAITSSAMVTYVANFIPWTPPIVRAGIAAVSYALLSLIAISGASALFHFGPDTPDRRFRWGTPGAVLATVVWLAATVGFGLYVANFGNYGATYGSISAIIVALTWLWLSMYAFLLGAQLDAELLAERSAPVAAPEPAADAAPRGTVAGVALTAVGLAFFALRRR